MCEWVIEWQQHTTFFSSFFVCIRAPLRIKTARKIRAHSIGEKKFKFYSYFCSHPVIMVPTPNWNLSWGSLSIGHWSSEDGKTEYIKYVKIKTTLSKSGTFDCPFVKNVWQQPSDFYGHTDKRPDLMHSITFQAR